MDDDNFDNIDVDNYKKLKNNNDNSRLLQENKTDKEKGNGKLPSTIQEIIGHLKPEELSPETTASLNSHFFEKKFFDDTILPLLSIFYNLSSSSASLAASVDILSKTYTKHPDRSELKDTVHLIYKINEEAEDVFEVLKKRINKLLELEKEFRE